MNQKLRIVIGGAICYCLSTLFQGGLWDLVPHENPLDLFVCMYFPYF